MSIIDNRWKDFFQRFFLTWNLGQGSRLYFIDFSLQGSLKRFKIKPVG